MSSFEETLPLTVGILLLPYLFSPHLPLEQVLLEPAVEATPTFLAKLEAMVVIAQIPLNCSTLKLVPHCPSFLSAFPLLSYFPSSYDLGQLPF